MSGLLRRPAAEKAFAETVRCHSRELFRYAYWLCRERARAEDLVQDTFARAWNAWNDIRDPRARRAWLYAILRHEHARFFERKRIELDERDLDDIDLPVESRPDVAIDVRRALHLLPESLREPLVLQVLGGFTNREIADLVGTTEGAVMTRLTRARQAMRKLYEHEAVKQEMAR